MELKRNKETGLLEGWEDGKMVGEIITMGDLIYDPTLEEKLKEWDKETTEIIQE